MLGRAAWSPDDCHFVHGLRAQLRDGAVGDDLPLLDNRDALAQFFNFRQRVAAKKNCRAGLSLLAEQLPQSFLHERVECRGWFIENEHARIMSHAQNQAQLLPHAPAHLPDLHRQIKFEHFRQFVSACDDVAPADATKQLEGRLSGEPRPKAQVARNRAYFGLDAMTVAPAVHVQNAGTAAAGSQEAQQHANRGGLAGTVGAQKSIQTASRNREVDIAHAASAAVRASQCTGSNGYSCGHGASEHSERDAGPNVQQRDKFATARANCALVADLLYRRIFVTRPNLPRSKLVYTILPRSIYVYPCV